MDELVQAPSSTALDANLRPRQNHLLQGILSFLAVVGVGAAVTVALHPPTRVRVITVEKQVPGPTVHTIERIVERAPAPPPTAARPPKTARRPRPQPQDETPQPAAASATPIKTDCNDDPLCGLGDLKQ